jgi:hypothetical protein
VSFFAVAMGLALTSGVAPAGSQASPQCFTVGYAKSESSVIDAYKAPMRQVYGNLGQCVKYMELPYARLMKMVSNNKIDAIMGRTLPAILHYPDLPYVPTPVASLKGYLVTNPEAAAHVKESVDNLSLYNVGGLSGSDWSMQTLSKIALDVKYTENIDQLISMYARRHLDGFLVSELFLPHVMNSLFKTKVSEYQTVLLYDVPVYHVLAPKHADIVPQLDVSVNRVLAFLAENADLGMTEPRNAL